MCDFFQCTWGSNFPQQLRTSVPVAFGETLVEATWGPQTARVQMLFFLLLLSENSMSKLSLHRAQ